MKLPPIPTDEGCETFLKEAVTDLVRLYGDKSLKRFESIYSHIFSTHLGFFFSIVHGEINDLFKFLNDKFRSNRHYNADESRKLIGIINLIEDAQTNVRGSKYEFEVDRGYLETIRYCKEFLSASGGSSIPEGFNKINLILTREAFFLSTSTSIKTKNGSHAFPLKVVGSGSYATVSKFIDTNYDIVFALKKAKKDLSEKEVERFKREFDEMKKLNSPYVIAVHSFDSEKLQYTMECADFTLDEFISTNNNTINISLRVNLCNQIFRAFEYLSSKKILHRDISTSNVLIKKYDNMFVVKISDFGLVKTEDSTLTSRSTEFKGSLNDPKLEIIGFDKYSIIHETFALTRLIYFVMTGKRKISSGVNSALDKFIEKGLSDATLQRFQSIQEMKREFDKVVPAIGKLV